MRTVVSSDKLKMLFQAYRDRNDPAFLRAAETIISEELAANHIRWRLNCKGLWDRSEIT